MSIRVKSVALTEFLGVEGVVLDVRSPSEYRHAHIPSAVNLPLFTDQERAQVGTLYKTDGQEAAIEAGLAFVGPKLLSLVKQAKHALNGAVAKVHCWRGGMRSNSVAWLLSTAGIQTVLLQGGYKTFRQHVHRLFEGMMRLKPKLLVLSGMTGSGKTMLLECLRECGEQVLHLEELARHRGSAYGAFGMAEQPSPEHFENTLCCAWEALDLRRPIWLEDESRMIGRCQIPSQLFECIKQAPCAIIETSLAERINWLVSVYGSIPRDQLIQATRRLERRLGSQRTREAISSIEQGQFESAIEMVLDYYDRTYRYGMERREQPLMAIPYSKSAHQAAIAELLQWGQTYYEK